MKYQLERSLKWLPMPSNLNTASFLTPPRRMGSSRKLRRIRNSANIYLTSSSRHSKRLFSGAWTGSLKIMIWLGNSVFHHPFPSQAIKSPTIFQQEPYVLIRVLLYILTVLGMVKIVIIHSTKRS